MPSALPLIVLTAIHICRNCVTRDHSHNRSRAAHQVDLHNNTSRRIQAHEVHYSLLMPTTGSALCYWSDRVKSYYPGPTRAIRQQGASRTPRHINYVHTGRHQRGKIAFVYLLLMALKMVEGVERKLINGR